MMKKNLLDGKPKVQLSLDLQTMADALPTAEIAVKAGVDWLEVGTPLILGEGLHAVAQLHKKYPNHPIIADLKTMDAGYLEAEMMYRNGASFVVVMGQAHEHTIREAVRAAKEFDRYIMGDIMLCPDKIAMAKKMEQMGVDVIIHHTGLDDDVDAHLLHLLRHRDLVGAKHDVAHDVAVELLGGPHGLADRVLVGLAHDDHKGGPVPVHHLGLEVAGVHRLEVRDDRMVRVLLMELGDGV